MKRGDFINDWQHDPVDGHCYIGCPCLKDTWTEAGMEWLRMLSDLGLLAWELVGDEILAFLFLVALIAEMVVIL